MVGYGAKNAPNPPYIEVETAYLSAIRTREQYSLILEKFFSDPFICNECIYTRPRSYYKLILMKMRIVF